MGQSIKINLIFTFRKFSVARKTNQLKIPYYVKDNFHSEYQGSVGRLEASVEEEYLNNLKHSCYRERNYSECWWNLTICNIF